MVVAISFSGAESNPGDCHVALLGLLAVTSLYRHCDLILPMRHCERTQGAKQSHHQSHVIARQITRR